MSRVNTTGRAGTKRKFRKSRINGQFAPRTIDMLRSPAFCALSLSARRILDRLEIELADHGGSDNGKLACTHDDFQRYGIHRNGIGPGIRELTALGFIEITVQGRGGNVGEFRIPSRYRLTYRNTDYENPTEEWRDIASDEGAQELGTAARKQKTSREIPTKTDRLPVTKTTNPVSVRNPRHLSISRPGVARVSTLASAAHRERDARDALLAVVLSHPKRLAVLAAYRTLALWAVLVLAEGDLQ